MFIPRNRIRKCTIAAFCDHALTFHRNIIAGVVHSPVIFAIGVLVNVRFNPVKEKILLLGEIFVDLGNGLWTILAKLAHRLAAG